MAGHEPLIGGLHLPDPDDRHVLAAALRAGAEEIVTFNLRDFPPAILGPLGVAAWHPDEFVCALLVRSPEGVAGAVRGAAAEPGAAAGLAGRAARHARVTRACREPRTGSGRIWRRSGEPAHETVAEVERIAGQAGDAFEETA